MNKVFNTKKFIHWCVIKGMTSDEINSHLETWVEGCEGKTSKETGRYYNDKWCDEVEDK